MPMQVPASWGVGPSSVLVAVVSQAGSVCRSDSSGLADEAVLRAPLMPCLCLRHSRKAAKLLRLRNRSAGSMSLASFSAQLEDANAVLHSEQCD